MSVLRFGRSFLRSFCKQFSDKGPGKVAAKSGLKSGGEISEGHKASARQLVVASRASQNASLFGRRLWRGFTSTVPVTQAASLRRMATSRFLRGCGPKAPVFAFLGFAYASNNVQPPKDVQEKEQFQKLHEWIQEVLRTEHMFVQRQENVEQPSLAGLKLRDYEVGERLGESSSNSAVYAAKYMGHEYAVKMLFNFGARSQSSALHREFAKEYQVLSVEKQQNTAEEGPSYTRMPPHPNITPVLHAFADNIPCLPDALTSYPAALPFNNGGFARNRTMFFVMPRYNRTVQEYIASSGVLDPRISTLLLLQLLEGIAHLVRYGVAHRDLKTDNLLLDESTGNGLCPRLVIADFGCCLADKEWGLVLPFYTAEIDRGGNCNLMAPEIACATPGQGSVLDYTNSDAWAAGAIAYELFGGVNPFSRERLDSRTYHDEQLPLLAMAPVGVRRVVSLLLRRDPSERIAADIAVTMLTLVLWAPTTWFHSKRVSVIDINRWLIGLSVQMVIHKGDWTLENEVLYRFLCQATTEGITEALELLTGDMA